MTPMSHAFNTTNAAMYGVYESLLIDYFTFWIGKNKNKNRNQRDGKTWTYNSIKHLQSIFHYLTVKQVRTAVQNLVTKKVIVKKAYNSGRWDQTAWYAFDDEAAFLSKPVPKGVDYGPEQKDPGWQTEIPYSGKSNCPTGQMGFAPQGKSITVLNNSSVTTGKGETSAPPIFEKNQEEENQGCAAAAQSAPAAQKTGRQWLIEEVRKFRDRFPAKYPGECLNDFIALWTQPNKRGKLKIDMMEFFSVSWHLKRFWKKCTAEEKRDYWEMERLRQPKYVPNVAENVLRTHIPG